MEVIDIGLDDLEADLNNKNNYDFNAGSSSVNFGSGIELLMNEKKRSSSGSTKIDLEDLNNLENELNELSGVDGNSGRNTPAAEMPSSSLGGGDSKKISGLSSIGNFFNFGSKKVETPSNTNDSNIGKSTAETINNTSKTWDGFSKMNSDIPASSHHRAEVPMTERERRRKKRMMIKKLEEWHDRGTIKNISRFTLDSPYDEIEDEYEGALEDKRKKDAIKLQGWWFTTVVNTLEYGNALLNPFDLNLDGWGEQVSDDLESYEEIFMELYEKYKGGKMAPELSLLLRLGFSAAVVNMSNKMLSSAAPGFNDVMKQSPELMRMFTNAAVDTMSKQSPTFEFAKNIMNPPDQVNTKYGPPPAAVETKNMGNMQTRPTTPAGQNMTFTAPVNSNSRPDLAAARPMFRESGIDVNNSYASAASDDKVIREPPSSFNPRPEMRGPQTTEIENILSGLKLKAQPPQQVSQQVSQQIPLSANTFMDNGDDSMISVNSLRDMDSVNLPKRTNRKPRQNRSDKNTVSLDI